MHTIGELQTVVSFKSNCVFSVDSSRDCFKNQNICHVWFWFFVSMIFVIFFGGKCVCVCVCVWGGGVIWFCCFGFCLKIYIFKKMIRKIC